MLEQVAGGNAPPPPPHLNNTQLQQSCDNINNGGSSLVSLIASVQLTLNVNISAGLGVLDILLIALLNVIVALLSAVNGLILSLQAQITIDIQACVALIVNIDVQLQALVVGIPDSCPTKAVILANAHSQAQACCDAADVAVQALVSVQSSSVSSWPSCAGLHGQAVSIRNAFITQATYYDV